MNAVESRRRWATRMIDRCATPPPVYGSPEWLRLSDFGLRRVGAVIVAAESWARSGDELVESLRTELEVARKAHKLADDAQYLARVAEHRETWGYLSLIRGAYADHPEFHGGGRSA